MKIALHHLKLIRCLDEEESLTRAAGVLHLSQPALSHQLKELEDSLGTKLFNRVGKKLLPTEAGRKVLASSHLILDELKKLQVEIENIKNGKSETIKISTGCYTCYHWLPSIIKQFQKGRDSVSIKIVAEATRKPYDFLAKGNIDIAIASVKPDNKNINIVRLFSDELVAVLYRSHPLANKKDISPSDFATETYISYDVDDADSSILTNFFRPSNAMPKSVMKIQLTEAIMEMVKANLGIAIMAKWAVLPYLKSKELVHIPIKSTARHKIWYAGYIGNPSLSILEFIDLVKKEFPGNEKK
jgi:LysR family transcriptional regulator, regulator for metE and metH